jgi:hypothetical protein
MAFRSDRHLATLISAMAQSFEAFSLTSSRCAAHIMARATIRTRSARQLAKWLGPYMAERGGIRTLVYGPSPRRKPLIG